MWTRVASGIHLGKRFVLKFLHLELQPRTECPTSHPHYLPQVVAHSEKRIPEETGLRSVSENPSVASSSMVLRPSIDLQVLFTLHNCRQQLGVHFQNSREQLGMNFQNSRQQLWVNLQNCCSKNVQGTQVLTVLHNRLVKEHCS